MKANAPYLVVHLIHLWGADYNCHEETKTFGPTSRRNINTCCINPRASSAPASPASTLSPLALPLSVQLLIISIAAAAPSHPEASSGKWNGVSPLAHYEIKIPPAFLK